MERHCGADDQGDDAAEDAVVNGAADIVALKRGKPFFGDAHAAGLAVADQRVQLGFYAAEAFEEFAFESRVEHGDEYGCSSRFGE